MKGSDSQSNGNNGAKEGHQNSESDDLCAICLNSIANSSTPENCSHRFCYPCLSQWSTDHNRCPSCRQQYANIHYNFDANGQFEVQPLEVGHDDDNGMQTFMNRMLLYVRVLQERNELLIQRENLRLQLRQLNMSLYGNESASEEERSTTVEQIQVIQREMEQLIAVITNVETTALALNPLGMELINQLLAINTQLNLTPPSVSPESTQSSPSTTSPSTQASNMSNVTRDSDRNSEVWTLSPSTSPSSPQVSQRMAPKSPESIGETNQEIIASQRSLNRDQEVDERPAITNGAQLFRHLSRNTGESGSQRQQNGKSECEDCDEECSKSP